MAVASEFTTGRLVTILGGRAAARSGVRDLQGLRAYLRKGLPYESVVALTKAYAIDLKRLAAVLAIPERTLARRKQEKRLRPDESDRVFRVARIGALAEEAFGDRDKAVRWLHRPNRALGNAIPLHHVDTELGAREVEDVLGRIAHGVYS